MPSDIATFDIDYLFQEWLESLNKDFNKIDSYADGDKVNELNQNQKNLNNSLNGFSNAGIAAYAEKHFYAQKKNHENDIYYHPNQINVPYLKGKVKLSKDEFDKAKTLVVEPPVAQPVQENKPIENPKVQSKDNKNKEFVANKIDLEKFKNEINNKPDIKVDYYYFDNTKCGLDLDSFYDILKGNKAYRGMSKDSVKGFLTKDYRFANDFIDEVAFEDQLNKEVELIKDEVKSYKTPSINFMSYIQASEYIDENGNKQKKLSLDDVKNNIMNLRDSGSIDTDFNLGLDFQATYRNAKEDLDDVNEVLLQAQILGDSDVYNSKLQEKAAIEQKITETANLFKEYNEAMLDRITNGNDEAEGYKSKEKNIGLALLKEAEYNYLLDKQNFLAGKIEIAKQNIYFDIEKSTIDILGTKASGAVYGKIFTALNEDKKLVDKQLGEAKKELAPYEELLKEFNSRNLKNEEFAKLARTNRLYNEKIKGHKEVDKKLRTAKTQLDEKKKDNHNKIVVINNKIKRFNNGTPLPKGETVEILNARKATLESEVLLAEKNINLLNEELKDRKGARRASLNGRVKKEIEQVRGSVKGFNEIKEEMNEFITTLDNRYNKINIYNPVEKGEKTYNEVFLQRYNPYKKELDKIRILKDYADEYKAMVLPDREIKAMSSDKDFVHDQTKFDRLVNTVLSKIDNEKDKDIVRDFVNTANQFRQVKVDTLESKLFNDETKNVEKIYEEGLETCKLNVPLSEAKSSDLQEINKKLIEFGLSNGFDGSSREVKNYINDKNADRLTANIVVYQSVTRLLNGLKDPEDYNKADYEEYQNQYEALTGIKENAERSLTSGIKSSDDDALSEITDVIEDKTTVNNNIPVSRIHHLFDSLVNPEGFSRREKVVSKETENTRNSHNKDITNILCDAYEFLKAGNQNKAIRNIKESKARVAAGMSTARYAQEKYDQQKDFFNNAQKDMDLYAYRYNKHNSLSFFQRLFDFNGRSKMAKSRAELKKNYNFSDTALDIIKHGSKITESQLIDCIKDSSVNLDDAFIANAIRERNFGTNGSVMKAYENFCKKYKVENQFKYVPDMEPLPEADPKLANIFKNDNVAVESKHSIIVNELAAKDNNNANFVNNNNNEKDDAKNLESKAISEDEMSSK